MVLITLRSRVQTPPWLFLYFFIYFYIFISIFLYLSFIINQKFFTFFLKQKLIYDVFNVYDAIINIINNELNIYNINNNIDYEIIL